MNERELTQDEQVHVIEELEKLILLRADYDNSPVASFQKNFISFLEDYSMAADPANPTPEELKEARLQTIFLELEEEHSMKSDVKEVFLNDEAKINFALEIMDEFSEYLKSEISDLSTNSARALLDEEEEEMLSSAIKKSAATVEVKQENIAPVLEVKKEEIQQSKPVEAAKQIVKEEIEEKVKIPTIQIPERVEEKNSKPKRSFWSFAVKKKA